MNENMGYLDLGINGQVNGMMRWLLQATNTWNLLAGCCFCENQKSIILIKKLMIKLMVYQDLTSLHSKKKKIHQYVFGKVTSSTPRRPIPWLVAVMGPSTFWFLFSSHISINPFKSARFSWFLVLLLPLHLIFQHTLLLNFFSSATLFFEALYCQHFNSKKSNRSLNNSSVDLTG